MDELQPDPIEPSPTEAEVEEIEAVLREMDQGGADLFTFEGGEGGHGTPPNIPSEVPLADFPPESGEGASRAECGDVMGAMEPEGFEMDPTVAPRDLPDPPEVRAVAIAEPMTAHDASIVALGDNLRQVTQLIESVGRTLEAQNQRSVRLMERLENVARTLEVLPDDADRGLEGLDAIEEAIHAQTQPMERIDERLQALPDMLQAVRETSESTRELFCVATRALASRMAFTAREERARADRESSRRRVRILAGTGLAFTAFFAGLFMSASDAGARAREALAALITADRPVHADKGEGTWHVVDVKRVPGAEQSAPAASSKPAEDESLGTDEEPEKK